MKRGKPPARRTPLKRGSTPLKRSRLNRRGKKYEREADAIDAFRAALLHRSGGYCEAPVRVRYGERVIEIAHTRRGDHDGSDPHHVWPEDRDAGRHDPERGLYLCAAAHRWTHEHPADAAIAGLLRPRELEGER